ncbi:cytochrome P450 [Rhodococcus sp. NCIMB 12038]|uniref:cytochrome P450 n=1 Tax=Rhodococcus sp. NCIMB 12038 TaxID=933800 RepID=UPI0015C65501|nr:cytochrome P450 [Rhodococcus sp. NCIMB 12038]
MSQNATLTERPSEADYLPWEDPEFVRAPWPWFDRLLTEKPVLVLDDGSVVVSKYADVVRFAKHPSLLSVPPDGIGDSPWAANLHSVLLTEGDDHRRIRRSFASWLTPKAVQKWGHTAADSARAALDRVGADGLIEAHSALGVQPAQDAMAHALGIPTEDGFPYIHATNLTMMSMGWNPTSDEITRAHEGFGYMMFQAERLIEAKRRHRGDGMLLDEMITAVDEGRLSERELKESIQILWGSAAHNPGHVMASALVDLADNPHVFTVYKQDPDSRDAIINEIFRRSLPEVALDRFTTEPLEIGGVTVPGDGTRIRFVLGAALRDRDVFPNPDEFDYQRPKEASMAIAFGVGTHNCAGQAMARAELRAVLDVIAERYAAVEIVGEPVWTNSDRHRNCEGLTVRLS